MAFNHFYTKYLQTLSVKTQNQPHASGLVPVPVPVPVPTIVENLNLDQIEQKTLENAGIDAFDLQYIKDKMKSEYKNLYK